MNDLISRQAAIDALHIHLMYRMGTDSNKKRLDDWINSLPSAQETHEERTETHACDCISRQAAIAHAVPLNLFGREVMMVSVSELENLPSAQPEGRRCSVCGCGYFRYDVSVNTVSDIPNYCPNCGCKMDRKGADNVSDE